MVTADFPEQIKELGATLTSIETVLDLDAMRAEIGTLQQEVGAPDLWDDQTNAQRVTGRLSTLQSELERITGLRQRLDDLEVMVQLAQEEDDAGVMAETDTELGRLRTQIESLEVRTLLSGEYDERDALMSIRSGAGGVDAADFAEMLQRMYVRWAERHGYNVEVYDVSY
ncbi:PCRF domain-containing protein, partial [Aeromicrobium sp.]|uniref:PCRF domain-containing protein n=1 Tax=Aeromicrobium sp. TaxID=1871063 RepID=UPI003C421115